MEETSGVARFFGTALGVGLAALYAFALYPLTGVQGVLLGVLVFLYVFYATAMASYAKKVAYHIVTAVMIILLIALPLMVLFSDFRSVITNEPSFTNFLVTAVVDLSAFVVVSVVMEVFRRLEEEDKMVMTGRIFMILLAVFQIVMLFLANFSHQDEDYILQGWTVEHIEASNTLDGAFWFPAVLCVVALVYGLLSCRAARDRRFVLYDPDDALAYCRYYKKLFLAVALVGAIGSLFLILSAAVAATVVFALQILFYILIGSLILTLIYAVLSAFSG